MVSRNSSLRLSKAVPFMSVSCCFSRIAIKIEISEAIACSMGLPFISSPKAAARVSVSSENRASLESSVILALSSTDALFKVFLTRTIARKNLFSVSIFMLPATSMACSKAFGTPLRAPMPSFFSALFNTSSVKFEIISNKTSSVRSFLS